MKVRPQTVWQTVVGSTPAGKWGLVVETLACGHPGKRTELARANRRIADRRLRVCLVCTTAQQAAAQQRSCATKRRYSSERSAQRDAAHWQGKRRPYHCPVCHQWHLTSTL